jgi:hypothetical protein
MKKKNWKEEKSKNPNKFTMATRSKALMDTMESKTSGDEDINNSLMMVKDEMEKDPMKFENAYFHPEKEKREGWRMAIKKELESMERCKVRTIIHKKDIPKERKVIGNRWVFVQKRNELYRARLVALGYSQTAGIDFLNHYSPVLCDTIFRLLLLIIQKLKLPAWSLDVETAFLNGDLSKEIFMKIPQGYNLMKKMENIEDKVFKLNKSIYGLVQAARQWHEKIFRRNNEHGF